MDHAEVLERIEEAVAGPGGLPRLGADPSPAAVAVREHVRSCAPCTAEWRAWSVVSLGLAAAAPETLEPSVDLRDRVIAAAAARARSAPVASGTQVAQRGVEAGVAASGATFEAPSSAGTATRSGLALGRRRGRAPTATTEGGSTTPARTPFRLVLLGAAAMVVLFLAGIALGRTFVSTPEAPRGDPGRVLAEAAAIREGNGFALARLETPEGDAGGIVVVSPGSGRLAVVSSVLPEPPEGTRYVCILDRSGVRTQVGYMRWEPTSDEGGLAYWAGDADPADLGTAGDVFIVQLDDADAEPALVGEFLG